ncbi:GNAT family N-acetyltransferase [Agrobacterium arsenijevicii]|uniref:GNAT family N-acetyltransferase n=1 Tax=Agrobacterium arsenijevicii TaxID=1585697 RepID=UPI0006986BFA
MTIKLLAASEAKKPELRDMLSDYLRELSQYGDVDREYPFFDCYWTDDDRWPYLIVQDENTVGFALVNTWSPSGKGTDFAIAEFYVLPEFRSAGVGRQAFSRLLHNRSGIWELGVMSRNEVGKAFWERILTANDISEIERIDLRNELVHRFSYKT